MSVKHWEIELNHNTYIKYSIEFLHCYWHYGTSFQTIQGTTCVAHNINLKQATCNITCFTEVKCSKVLYS